MNFQEKFNYAVIKKINQNDIEFFEIDNGSIKKASISFIFRHLEETYFFCLSYTRQHKSRKNYFDYNANDFIKLTLYKTPDAFETEQNLQDYQFIDKSVIQKLASITKFEEKQNYFVRFFHFLISKII